ncbi:hypothetical protein MPER_12795, partial [Moniliophthora perniciosa FA553]
KQLTHATLTDGTREALSIIESPGLCQTNPDGTRLRFPRSIFRRQDTNGNTYPGNGNRPFELVLRKMKEGTVSPCLVAEELEELLTEKTDKGQRILRNVAATSYADVQSKAQAELDRVLGDRLPAFTDRQHLPYIDCICYELLRWNPVTPLGIAHYVSEEDEYRGYRIPRGTTVLPNTWAILHDPFDPDRFENMEEHAKKDINSIPDAAFGYGRRRSEYALVADDRGNTIESTVEYTSGLLSIKPRSSTAKDLIMHTQPL